MPRAKKTAAKKSQTKSTKAPKKTAPTVKGRTLGKLAVFVLAQDAKLSAPEVVEKAKAAGFDLTTHRVHNIRWAAKQKGKKGKATTKAVKPSKAVKLKAKPGTVAKAAKPVTGPSLKRRSPPARSNEPRATSDTLGNIAPLDLAYAVGRLVEAGRTTGAEVMQLALERSSLISALEADLAALKAGALPAESVPAKAPAPKTTKKALAKPAKTVPVKKGNVITRKDGRTFTMTPKAAAARKLQGMYLGFLRQLPKPERAKIKAIAKDKGVAAAVEELKAKLGKK